MKRILSLCLTILLVIGLFFSISNAESISADNITIYYPNGDWKYVPVSIKLPDKEENICLYALNKLILGHKIPDNCYDELPNNIIINYLKLNKNKVYLDFDIEFINNLDKVNNNLDVIKDIISYNIFNITGANEIIYTFNGNSIKNFDLVKSNDFFGTSTTLLNDKEIIEKQKKYTEMFYGMTKEERREYIANLKTNSSKTTPNDFTTLSSYTPNIDIVVLDPGHGGYESGAVGTYNGTTYYEKNENLELANYVKSWLEMDGYTVYMTRTSDVYVSLSSRYNYANNMDADAFMSIHHNASINTSVHGTTCLYPNNHDIDWSQDMALYIHDGVLDFSDLEHYTTPYEDVRNLAVLRGTNMPAIITETGFMSNQGDMAIITNYSEHDDVAWGIAEGFWLWTFLGEY